MKIQSHPARLYLAGMSLALAGAFVTTSAGRAGRRRPDGTGPDDGPGPDGRPGWPGGPGGGMFDGMMTRMLDRVNATPEQRTQIKQIMESQAADMHAQREAGRALREQAMTLFTQPTVDATAVEALRQQQLAMHDAGQQAHDARRCSRSAACSRPSSASRWPSTWPSAAR